MKLIIAKIEKALNVKIEVVKSRPNDIIQIVGVQELSREELEKHGEILLQKGFKKQLSELFLEDAIYVEDEYYLVSIDQDGEIHIMELDDL